MGQNVSNGKSEMLTVAELASRWRTTPQALTQRFRQGKLLGAIQPGGRGSRILIPMRGVQQMEAERSDRLKAADDIEL